MNSCAKRIVSIFTLGVFFSLVGICFAETPPDFKSSVIKIFCSYSLPDYRVPWQTKQNGRAIGSGAVISGNRILTSAHVVEHATYIEVKKSNSDKRYRAEVQAIGNDCDLAILKVQDESFFEGVPSLPIGPLPELQDSVLVVGFPEGGDELSVTKGVVSRIDAVPYSYSNATFMAAQIDAAVNSGNSGGPVIQNNQLVGIAFQTLSDADNIGYMVPEPIIRHFLEDLDDGKYDGFPIAGIWWNQPRNPFMREQYGLKDYEGGLVIKHVSPEAGKDGLLRTGDVVLSIDGVPVGSDATVSFRKNSRMPVGYLFDLKQVGETINFEILRDRKKLNIKVPLLPDDMLVTYKNFYEKPPYYIYGGAVFTILTENLIGEFMSKEKGADLRTSNLIYYDIGPGRFATEEKKEVVVLLYVLPDEVNVGYHDIEMEVVRDTNGKSIRTLEELASILENNQEERATIRTEGKDELIFNRKKVEEAMPSILKNYGISSAYSDDIKKKLDENKFIRSEGTEPIHNF